MAVALIVSLGTPAAGAPAEAQATPAPTRTPAASPTPVSRVTRQLLNKRLDLPSYARYGTDPFGNVAELPAFSETVEVVAKPMDTQSLTAKMNWWMNDFEPVYAGAGPASFHAPNLSEMREYRPSPPQSADLSLLAGWLLGKLTKGDKKDK